jgi:lycopene beta-cyclase
VSSKYDYIICGAGCSGLSLVMHIIQSGKFNEKKILLIDKDPKRANDRTWCFWQKNQGLFEPVVYRQWDHLLFYGEDFSRRLEIAPYLYKMVRGIDFYEYCFKKIGQHSNIDILFEKVDRIFSESKTGVVVNNQTFYADYVFNSILFEKPQLHKNESWLLQHFKGWVIETGEDCLDQNVATLMDFRIKQDFGTTFCYVLPIDNRRALIEYTVFSGELLQQDQYDEGLQYYIKDILNITSYRIVEKEFGVIPMTDFKFSSHQNNIIHIGTAGGQTKGSSGYTFNFIQKHSKAIVDALVQTGRPFITSTPKRFNFYDSVLLKVLEEGMVPGTQLFTDLFEKNPIDKIFKFLDNESTIGDEIKIISTLPTMPFFKAGIRQI